MTKVNFSIKDSMEKLEKSLENLGPTLEEEMNNAIRDLAHAAYAEIVSKAQTDLESTREQYLEALHFEDLGDNSFLISLDGAWAQKLEDGFASYNLNDVLLKSTKTVDKGSRSGQPWVRENKEGGKYAAVPLEKNPSAKPGSKAGDLAETIKQMTSTNAKGRQQKINSIFKGLDGRPMEGKVAVASSDNPMLNNLVKYQSVKQGLSGKSYVQSTYINYRMVSEDGKPWIHPGFSGLHAFDNAEKMIVEHIDQILKSILGKN